MDSISARSLLATPRDFASRITLDVYTQAVNSNKRAAQSKVVTMMVSDVGQKREEKYPQTV